MNRTETFQSKGTGLLQVDSTKVHYWTELDWAKHYTRKLSNLESYKNTG